MSGKRSNRHVCLVTGGHLWRNPRLVKEADLLHDAGFKVTVVGPVLRQDDQERDLELLSRKGWRRIAAPDLLRPSLLSARSTISRAARRLSLIAVRTTGIQLETSLGYSIWETIGAARREAADLYSCHQEPGLVALFHLHRHGLRCAVDIEDWYSRDLLPEAQRERPLRRLDELERYALRHSALTITTSRALASELAQTYGVPEPEAVYNAFPQTDREAIDGHVRDRLDPGRLSLHWYSQTTGPGRGLEVLIDAVDRLAGRVELHVRGDGSDAYKAALLSRVSAKVRPQIAFHPTVPPAELLSRIAEHDLGFSLDSSTPPSRDLTVTNKVFQYLLAGVPVVASPTSGNLEVHNIAPEAIRIAEMEAGALAAAIDGFLRDRSRLQLAKSAAGRAAAGALSWEAQAERLLAAYDRVLSGPSAGGEASSTYA